ncbi:MAG: hypothetical protein M1827_000279 [Pycnora praestabilis]|nr:MAG: hypothetical protein M1827_000279 [Pycnora praestabilis]
MVCRGERFDVYLSSDDEDTPQSANQGKPSAVLALGFIGDIKERPQSTTARSPSAPTLKSSETGFPAHKKRSRISAFKRQKSSSSQDARVNGKIENTVSSSQSLPQSNSASDATFSAISPVASECGPNLEETERRRIDEENNKRLAAMSTEEIERERQELLSGLSPSLIERLITRANMDDGRGDTGNEPEESQRTSSKASTKTVKFDTAALPLEKGQDSRSPTTDNVDSVSLNPPPSIHFPHPEPPPDLDPSDPAFLTNLHNKYFPTLSADPSKLAWMAPLPSSNSIADQQSPYSPSQETLPASSIRFDFRGILLAPRAAREVPVTEGLHHHGEAPEAAGYTVPELARLARSAFPAQRCVAYQTLGRMLYRLGKGYYGEQGSELVVGLWQCVESGRVTEGLQEEASREGGHVSAKAYATEAVWNWQRGGGGKWNAA